MNKQESSDAFAHYVMGQIKPEIRKSLKKDQFDEIRSAISAASSAKKHSIDIRGMLPLFFARYYFVILMGRDRRSKTKFLEFNRRNEGNLLSNQLVVLLSLVPVILAMFIIFYFFKTEAGIDFFPNYHLSDLFK
jgi:hypothetical protein